MEEEEERERGDFGEKWRNAIEDRLRGDSISISISRQSSELERGRQGRNRGRERRGSYILQRGEMDGLLWPKPNRLSAFGETWHGLLR